MSTYDNCEICGRNDTRGDWAWTKDERWLFVCCGCQERSNLRSPMARYGG